MPEKRLLLLVEAPEQWHIPTNFRLPKSGFIFVEIVLSIVLKLCYVVLGHSEVGEKLQRVACREVVDRNFVIERL